MALAILLPIAIISPFIAVCIGSADIPVIDFLVGLFGLQPLDEMAMINQQIILEIRMPRVLMAMICGAGLAVSGAILQCVTRNPLADPYLFGISSGSSLGAVIAMTVGFAGLSLPACAFLGALLAVSIVMLMAKDGQVERLILAGVAISFLLSSISNLLIYFNDHQAMQAVLFWTMGSFARASWANIWLPLISVIVTLIAVQRLQRPLQALMAGDESAHTQGVAVIWLRLGMLLLTAVVTASLVAYCGGIGFVGLMVPHIVRLAIGAASPIGYLITAIAGAILMVWVDLLCRTLLPQQELPVGVVTAILGSLFFLGILTHRKQKL